MCYIPFLEGKCITICIVQICLPTGMRAKQFVLFWCFLVALCIVWEFRSHNGLKPLFCFFLRNSEHRPVAQSSRQNFTPRVMGWLAYILWKHHLPLCCPSVLPYKEPIKRALLLKLNRLSVCSTRTHAMQQMHAHCCDASCSGLLCCFCTSQEVSSLNCWCVPSRTWCSDFML